MNKLFLKLSGIIVIGLFLAAMQNISFAQESKKGHSHAKAEMHGGSVAMSRHHHFEVVFAPDAIDVYLYDGVQNPLSAKGVEGEVTLKFKNGEPQILPLKFVSMHKEMAGDHKEMNHEHMKEKEDHEMTMGMDCLKAKVDLSKVEAGTMKAVFALKGLPNKKETEATFTETFNGFAEKKEKQSERHDAHKN